MIRTVYIPAISFGTLFDGFKDNNIIGGKSVRFYNTLEQQKKLFKWPNILFSAGHNWYKKNNADLSQLLSLDLDPKKGIVMTDSGGYQIAKGVLEYSDKIREIVFEWCNNNSNVSVPLDSPPFVSAITKGTDFNKSLELSAQNIEWLYKEKYKKGKTKSRFLNVLQGRSVQHFNKWYDKVHKFRMDGWAIGSVSVRLHLLFMVLAFMLEKNEFEKSKIIHIFGTSKPLVELSYFNYKLRERGYDCLLTFDSSSPLFNAAFGNWIINFNHKTNEQYPVSLSNTYDWKNLQKGQKMPCVCPVCRNITFDYVMGLAEEYGDKDPFPRIMYMVIGLHNLFKCLELKNLVDSFIEFNIEEVTKKAFGKEKFRIFKIIDKMFELKNPVSYIENHQGVISKLVPSGSQSKLTEWSEGKEIKAEMPSKDPDWRE